jgi:hypothetical protein
MASPLFTIPKAFGFEAATQPDEPYFTSVP